MKRIFLVFIIGILFCSCGDEEEKSNIPSYAVNLTIDLGGVDNHLAVIGNIGAYLNATDRVNYDKLVNGVKGVKVYTAPRLTGEAIGFGGLLVVRTGVETDQTSGMAAFDVCCPNEVVQRIKVVPTSSGTTAKCPECGSEFDLWANGRAIGGAAENKKQNLKSYRIIPHNGKFRVVN